MAASERVSILFVCTGNICRSPLAEYQLRKYAQEQGKNDRITIGSAGIHACTGYGATHEALEAGRLAGLDLAPHRARQINYYMMLENPIVLAMTQRHHSWLTHQFPEHKNAIYLTRLFPARWDGEDPESTDVPDPIGESVEFYIDVLEMLRPALPKVLRGALGEEIT